MISNAIKASIILSRNTMARRHILFQAGDKYKRGTRVIRVIMVSWVIIRASSRFCFWVTRIINCSLWRLRDSFSGGK